MKRIITALSTLVAARPTEAETVHFHAGSRSPYVCDADRCTSPRLSVSDVG